MKPAPVFFTISAISMDALGSMVLISIQVFVSSSASRISEYTARECSDFGTMEIITSDFSASSTEVSHATAPFETRSSTFSFTKSNTYTVSSCFFTIFSLMDSPIIPSPINPIFMLSPFCIRCGTAVTLQTA